MAKVLTRQGVRNLDLIGPKPKPSQATCSHPAGDVVVDDESDHVICKRCRRDFGPRPV